MSIEKKSLISNRAATKKANLTKVNAAAQVSATKLSRPSASARTKVMVNTKMGAGHTKMTVGHAKLSVSHLSSTLMRG